MLLDRHIARLTLAVCAVTTVVLIAAFRSPDVSSSDGIAAIAERLTAPNDDVAMSRGATHAVVTATAPSRVKTGTAAARPIATGATPRRDGSVVAASSRSELTPRYRLFRVLRI